MRLDRIPTRSHLLAKILVVLLWLIAIAAVLVVGWLVASDIVKRHSQPHPTAGMRGTAIETPGPSTP